MAKQSAIYTTTAPLVANGFFAPLVWEDVLAYNSYSLTFLGDTDCIITVQFSNDKFNITSSQEYNVLAGVAFNFSDSIQSRYFRLRVDNQEAVQMMQLTLSTYYREAKKSSNVVSATLWPNVSTGVGGNSAVANGNLNNKNYTFFGNVNGATVLTVQTSNDGNNWYSTQYSYTASTAGDFGFNIAPLVAQYVRLSSSADVIAVAIVNSN